MLIVPSRLRQLAFVAIMLVGLGAWPASPTMAQQDEAPKTASYVIQAQLDPDTKTVTGTERIIYKNPSEDTLDELWLRLYLKAFSTLDSIWIKESGGQLRGDELDETKLGDITLSSLTLNGQDLLATSTLTDTLLRVPLTTPLGPNQQIELEAAWTSKLPRVFARTGYGGENNTFFMVGQWYPKMAVYDRGAWDTEPWHGNSEFFNEFGSYDVQVTVPENYVVAGAGVPAGDQPGSSGTHTYRFTSDNVTDWAFAASPDFKTVAGKAGAVDVAVYYLPEHESAAQTYLESAIDSVTTFSNWYGQYPHPRLTIVDVPDDASGAGGMEYPTLVTTEYGGGISGFQDYVTSHEVGHQWWPMQTATNEGREPWLDEGLTEYSGMRYLIDKGGVVGAGGAGLSGRAYERTSYLFNPHLAADRPAWEYESGSYAIVYFKTSVGMYTLENLVGTDKFRDAMKAYLTAYRYKHPTAKDFRRVIESKVGPQPWFFDEYMATNGVIDYAATPITKDGADSIVTVNRVGEIAVPVEIEVTLANGSVETKTWDGKSQSVQYRYAEPVGLVQIDPQQKLAAEIDLDNNIASGRPEAVTTLSLGERLVFWLQAVVQVFGLFG